MVKTSTVTESNQRFANDQHHDGLVCVFAGATSGIGLATLNKMATMLQRSTFYILGRSPSRYAGQLDQLRKIAPGSKFIFIETQVSLISGIGGIPFQGAVYTTEGLETCFAISYYSRLRLVSNLLPLFQRASQPRVLSILNGTKEKRINEEDINLGRNWGIVAVVNHTTLLTSLAFDYLSANEAKKHITFLHATPGLVRTGTVKNSAPPKEKGWLWWAFIKVMKTISAFIVRFIGLNIKESGERHAYKLTSDTFPPGSWRVDKNSDVEPDNKVLTEYQKRGWADKVWEHTQSIWDKALATAGTS